MTFNELSDKLFANYESGAISDEQLLQIIELAKTYLNLKTITNTAVIQEIENTIDLAETMLADE